jgi:hypothetical protein
MFNEIGWQDLFSLIGSQAWRGEAFECNSSPIFKSFLEQESLNHSSKDSIAQGFILSKKTFFSLSFSIHKNNLLLVTLLHARFNFVI